MIYWNLFFISLLFLFIVSDIISSVNTILFNDILSNYNLLKFLNVFTDHYVKIFNRGLSDMLNLNVNLIMSLFKMAPLS